jgi:hypothetical protein
MQRARIIPNIINKIHVQSATLKSTTTPISTTEPASAPLTTDTPSTSTIIQQTATIATPASTTPDPPVETSSYSRLRQLVVSVLPFGGHVGSVYVYCDFFTIHLHYLKD